MKAQLSLALIGSTFNRINISRVESLLIACPPRGEQNATVSYLDKEMAIIDGQINRVQQAITLLRERRSAIITAAVTGQIDVRGNAGALAEVAL